MKFHRYSVDIPIDFPISYGWSSFSLSKSMGCLLLPRQLSSAHGTGSRSNPTTAMKGMVTHRSRRRGKWRSKHPRDQKWGYVWELDFQLWIRWLADFSSRKADWTGPNQNWNNRNMWIELSTGRNHPVWFWDIFDLHDLPAGHFTSSLHFLRHHLMSLQGSLNGFQQRQRVPNHSSSLLYSWGSWPTSNRHIISSPEISISCRFHLPFFFKCRSTYPPSEKVWEIPIKDGSWSTGKPWNQNGGGLREPSAAQVTAGAGACGWLLTPAIMIWGHGLMSRKWLLNLSCSQCSTSALEFFGYLLSLIWCGWKPNVHCTPWVKLTCGWSVPTGGNTPSVGCACSNRFCWTTWAAANLSSNSWTILVHLWPYTLKVAPTFLIDSPVVWSRNHNSLQWDSTFPSHKWSPTFSNIFTQVPVRHPNLFRFPTFSAKGLVQQSLLQQEPHGWDRTSLQWMVGRCQEVVRNKWRKWWFTCAKQGRGVYWSFFEMSEMSSCFIRFFQLLVYCSHGDVMRMVMHSTHNRHFMDGSDLACFARPQTSSILCGAMLQITRCIKNHSKTKNHRVSHYKNEGTNQKSTTMGFSQNHFHHWRPGTTTQKWLEVFLRPWWISGMMGWMTLQHPETG